MENQSILQDNLIKKGYKWGGEEVEVDSPYCFAKSIENPGLNSTRYFVKRVTMGQGAGTFLNPQDSNYNESQLKKYSNSLGRAVCEFCSVSKAAFDLYVLFLKSKNSNYCLQAQRECD